MKEILLTFDGGAKPNPGEGYGSFHIREDNKEIPKFSEIEQFYGENLTSNQTEYMAVIRGIRKVIQLYGTTIDLKIKGDSELIVKQIRGEYKVKNKRMKPLYADAMELLMQLHSYEIKYWNRENSVREFGH